MAGGAPVRTHSERCNVHCEEGYAIYMCRHGEVPVGERSPKRYPEGNQQPSRDAEHSPTRPCPNTTIPCQSANIYLRNLSENLVARPFSRSSGRNRGVGGTSSARRVCFRRPDDEFSGSLRCEGNSERRGVRAVLTFLADLLSVSFIVHSRFLAMKKRAPVVAPRMATATTTTTMAMSPPVEME